MQNWNSRPFLVRLRRSALGAAGAASLFSGAALAEGAAPASNADVGSVWWSEIVSANPALSRDFYTSVFGWTPKVVSAEDTSRPPASGEGDYTIYMRGDAEVAGGAALDPVAASEVRPGWLNYIQVANVDAAVAEAVKKGGKIVKAPYDAANSGRFAIIQDPEGLAIGLVTPISASATH